MMEDAATAEISRSQVWQWLHNGVTLADTGELVTARAGRAGHRRGAGAAGRRDLERRRGRCSWRWRWPTTSSIS